MIETDFSLKKLNTFGFEAQAKFYARPETPNDAKQIIKEYNNTPLFILGGGSNVLFTRDFDGLILHPDFKGIEKTGEDSDYIYARVGAGEVWDDFVKTAVENGWGGVENLSMIPGNVGASPVQNIGAYGSEAKDTIFEVEGFYIDTCEDFKINNRQCHFGYRDSIFKNELKGRAVICHVTFRLNKKPILKTEYGNIKDELTKYSEINIANIRKAVCDIRSAKLPDPLITGNAGSFFKNPVVSENKAAQLLSDYPEMPVYPAIDGKKLAAGKLIELCGLKGYKHGNVGVHDKQALVLVNLGNGTAKELIELAEKVISDVKSKFGVDIEPEVNFI